MKLRTIFIFIAGFQILLFSCAVPLRSFEHTPKPAPPDYSQEKYWAALPDRKDSADFQLINYGITDSQKDAKVDAFFITPTNYITGSKWNVSLENADANKETDTVGCKLLASAYNGTCKIYSPRYRSAIFYSYFASKKNSRKAFELAYEDVRNAFQYYLKHYNSGRPIVIASHSQGTDYAIRLLKEFFDNDSKLRTQFVEAYLIGRPVYDTTFKTIFPSASATETGGFVTWNGVSYHTNTFYGDVRVGKIIGINPLTWKRDNEYAPASLNKGALPFRANKVDPELVDAKVAESGFLWIHRPDKSNEDYPGVKTSYYHKNDYAFFYMNIRENVAQRVEQFLKERKSK